MVPIRSAKLTTIGHVLTPSKDEWRSRVERPRNLKLERFLARGIRTWSFRVGQPRNLRHELEHSGRGICATLSTTGARAWDVVAIASLIGSPAKGRGASRCTKSSVHYVYNVVLTYLIYQPVSHI